MRKVVEPVKAGTSASAWCQTRLRVVVAQRSGGPNSSTSRSRVSASYWRRAGSIITWAVSTIAYTCRPPGSETCTSKSSAGTAA